jgi:hypothetical protein
MIEYAITFWREKHWADKLSKPVGWATSPNRTSRKADAQKTVDAINAHKPVFPAHVVELTK